MPLFGILVHADIWVEYLLLFELYIQNKNDLFKKCIVPYINQPHN